MFITQEAHLPTRRAEGHGCHAGPALPGRDGAGGDGVGQDGRRPSAMDRTRLVAMEMVHGCGRAARKTGCSSNMWSPAATGTELRSRRRRALKSLEPYREYLTIISNTQNHAAEAWSAPEIGGDHFRSSATYLTQAHPKQTEGSNIHAGMSIDQIYAKEYGPGHGDPVDAAVHRAGGPGRRLRLRLRLRLHGHDVVGVAHRAAAGHPRPARGLQSDVRPRRHRRRTGRQRRDANASILDWIMTVRWPI